MAPEGEQAGSAGGVDGLDTGMTHILGGTRGAKRAFIALLRTALGVKSGIVCF